MQQFTRSPMIRIVSVAAAVWILCTAAWAGDVRSFQNTRPGSSQAMVIERNKSVMLKFNGLRRVAVVHPDVADVAVMSADELLVRATARATSEQQETMLYVWDRDGLHNFAVTVVGARLAEKIARELQASLGPHLSARVVSESLVVIEGQVASAAALRNLETLLEAASTDDVTVVAMVCTAEEETASRALQAAAALSQIIGPGVEISAWGDEVLVIEGELSQEQILRARDAINTVGQGLRVVDMLTVEGEGLATQAPVEQIQRLLGDRFVVSQLRGRLIAIEGVVENQQAMERVNNVLKAFEDVQAINLVQVVPPRPDLDTAQAALRGALDGTEIVVQRIGDEALMLEGSVPSEEALERLGRVMALFEDRVPIVNLVNIVEPDRRRVLVAVKVLEVTRGAGQELGVDWGHYRPTPRVDAEFQEQPFLFGQIRGIDGWPELFHFAAQVHALIQDSKARILSEPNLLVNEEEEASILIGGEIPVPIAQSGVGGAASVTVEWKPFGVTLNIRPTINPDSRQVRLEVSPEVSSLDFASGVTVGGLSIPALRTRRAETTVSIADGGVLAIGGLIQSTDSKSVSKIPLLGDLPIIGQLFRHDTTRRETSELIILVMPQILGEDGRPLHPVPVPEGMEEEVGRFGGQVQLEERRDD